MLKKMELRGKKNWNEQSELIAPILETVPTPVPAMHFVDYEQVENAFSCAMPPSREIYNHALKENVAENLSSAVPYAEVCDMFQHNAIVSSMYATDKDFISNTKMTHGDYNKLMVSVIQLNNSSLSNSIRFIMDAITCRVFKEFIEESNFSNCNISDIFKSLDSNVGYGITNITQCFANHFRSKTNPNYNERFFNDNITDYWMTLLGNIVTTMLSDWYSNMSKYALQVVYSNILPESEAIEKMKIFNDICVKAMAYAYDTILTVAVGYFEFGMFGTAFFNYKDI